MNTLQQTQKLLAKMNEMQENLERKEVVGESGAGMVKITMNCKNIIKFIKIDPSLTNDVEILEDLIVAAFNDAQEKINKHVAEEGSKMSLGLPKIPGLTL